MPFRWQRSSEARREMNGGVDGTIAFVNVAGAIHTTDVVIG
jgi:hypothetical protein